MPVVKDNGFIFWVGQHMSNRGCESGGVKVEMQNEDGGMKKPEAKRAGEGIFNAQQSELRKRLGINDRPASSGFVRPFNFVRAASAYALLRRDGRAIKLNQIKVNQGAINLRRAIYDLRGCLQKGEAGYLNIPIAGQSGKGLPHSRTLARSTGTPRGSGKNREKQPITVNNRPNFWFPFAETGSRGRVK